MEVIYYYFTYLCAGKFVDQINATVEKEVLVSTTERLIEIDDWLQGKIDFEEAQRALSKFVDFVPEQGTDLFMKEEMIEAPLFLGGEMKIPPKTNSVRSILISENYGFTSE